MTKIDCFNRVFYLKRRLRLSTNFLENKAVQTKGSKFRFSNAIPSNRIKNPGEANKGSQQVRPISPSKQLHHTSGTIKFREFHHWNDPTTMRAGKISKSLTCNSQGPVQAGLPTNPGLYFSAENTLKPIRPRPLEPLWYCILLAPTILKGGTSGGGRRVVPSLKNLEESRHCHGLRWQHVWKLSVHQHSSLKSGRPRKSTFFPVRSGACGKVLLFGFGVTKSRCQPGD